MRRSLLPFALCMLLCLPCAVAKGDEALVERRLSQMTLDEKICQLFFLTPESFSRLSLVTKPSNALASALKKTPVGGVIFFSDHFVSVAQTQRLCAFIQQNASNGVLFFLGTDEEGGGVSRAINKLGLQKAPSFSDITDASAAYNAGSLIGSQLTMLGLNFDFAPVADVRTDLDDVEITARSFGYDATQVAELTGSFTQGLTNRGIIATLKHFPGHGSAVGNSHDGKSVSTRTVKQWRSCEWLPFRSGLDAGAEVVLLSHQVAAVVDHAFPASLSPIIVTGLLRGELGFDGVVITDGLRMDAISDNYSSGEACVLALEAGADMLLLPKNFSNALEGVRNAVQSGRITEARIDESVRRILTLKDRHGLLEEDTSITVTP